MLSSWNGIVDFTLNLPFFIFKGSKNLSFDALLRTRYAMRLSLKLFCVRFHGAHLGTAHQDPAVERNL